MGVAGETTGHETENERVERAEEAGSHPEYHQKSGKRLRHRTV